MPKTFFRGQIFPSRKSVSRWALKALLTFHGFFTKKRVERPLSFDKAPRASRLTRIDNEIDDFGQGHHEVFR